MPNTIRFSRVLSALSVPLWLSVSCFAGEPPRADVVPLPQQVAFDPEAFEIDGRTVIMVSGQATEGTRRAARALQAGLRERYGVDLRIVRVAEQQQFKAIWIIGAGETHSPANTIGVDKLAFTEPMRAEGYFIRVDMAEIVVHAASDAGTLYGVETLSQLVRPPRAGSLFRAGHGPTVPCLWMADWPANAVRPACVLRPPRVPAGVERYLRTLAQLRVNAIVQDSPEWLAEGPAGARLAELAPQWFVRILTGPPPPRGPIPPDAAVWGRPGAVGLYAEAMLADQAWNPTGLDPASFRLRFARARFGTDAAAEAIGLTEECIEKAPRRGHAIPLVQIAEAQGEQAKDMARARSEHERRARRVRALWRSIGTEPALRDAFLAAAERGICLTDDAYALADAQRSYRRGRVAEAARVLRARLDSLGWLGEGATETRRAMEALIARLAAAAKAPKLPPIQDVFSGSF